MPRVTVSLCMIVKNESTRLARAIKSARGLVQEVIITDTGSTDGTKDIARRLGAEVHDFAWNDNFADARNASIEKATGDWILVLDGDEYLEPAEDYSQLAGHLANDLIDGYLFGWKNTHPHHTGRPGRKLVLFRNKEQIRFQGIVHEEVFSSIEPHAMRILPFTVLHDASPAADQAKNSYYLSLTKKQVLRSPNDARYQYLLGRHYLRERSMVEARHHFLLASELSSQRPSFALQAALALLRLSVLLSPHETEGLLRKCRGIVAEHSTDPEIVFHPQIDVLDSLEKMSGRPLYPSESR
jgi:glycosyltransferase involved in cell wall biosynthesis